MIEAIIYELEKSIDTDDFEYIMDDCIMKLQEQNAGIEAVLPLLQLMERHPMYDFGMPGAIVHFVERFYKKGYEELLIDSVERRPTMHTVWMLNRLINGSDNKLDYIEVMKKVINRSSVEHEIKQRAQSYINRQLAI